MANQFTELIETLRDQSDKESNKSALFDAYSSLPLYLQPLYVQELINQFEEYIEKAHYLYLHDHN